MTENVFLQITLDELKLMIAEAVQDGMKKFTSSKNGSHNEVNWIPRIEAAKHLNISLPTLDKLTKEGKLTAYRCVRKKVYNIQELNEAIGKLKIKYK